MVSLEEVAGQFTEVEWEAAICRESFREHVKAFWECVPGAGKLKWNWHMDIFCSELQTIAERVFAGIPAEYDLVVNVPPGTSKSTVFSILFHTWVWIRMPEARFINATHTHDLVLSFADKTLQVLQSEKYKTYFPEIELRRSAMGSFANSRGGDRLAATVGGKSPLGFHGHFLIGDDLIDPNKAISEVELTTARNFVENDLPTRVVDKQVSVMILIMQRLGRGDPTEVMLDGAKKEGARPVRHICLPCDDSWKIVPEEEEFAFWDDETKAYERRTIKQKYAEGEGLLDPIRLPRVVLKSFRAKGEYRYAGQFGQAPMPLGGGMFKCLVAGTLIRTDTGHKKIENVEIGDWVLTRKGYKPVLWSGCSGYVDKLITLNYSNGGSLTATEDHRIWHRSIGFKRADAFSIGDSVLGEMEWNFCKNGCKGSLQKAIYVSAVVENRLQFKGIIGRSGFPNTFMGTTAGNQTRKLLNLMEFCTTFTQMAIGGAREEKSLCIEQYGNSTTALYQKDMRFITRMEIAGITKSRISNAYLIKTISIGTGRENGPLSKKRMLRPLLAGFQRTRRGLGKRSPIKNIRVGGVARNLNPGQEGLHITAVARVKLEGTIPVYDLEVEGAHEFFANGILVHNSHFFNQRVKAAPYNAKRIRYIDRASTADGGCFTACVLMAKDAEGNYYVEHVEKGQWEPDERNQRLRALALRDRGRYGPNHEPVIWVEAEGGSSGRDAWKGVARALAGFPVFEDKVTGAKDTRAEPWSSQCAAKNVYIVEDGTWDVNGYVQEHCMFRPEPGKRLGKWKDQVDASSGAFNLLVGSQGSGIMRVIPLGKSKNQSLRIVTCSQEELANTIVEQRAVLLSLQEPDKEDLAPPPVVPLHGCNLLLDSLILQFADIQPVELQQVWNETLPQYNKLPEQVVMSNQEHGKKLWAFLLKKRNPGFEVIVIQDQGDRRAFSMGLALAHVLRLEKTAVNRLSNPNNSNGDIPNKHVYDVVVASRGLVV